MMTFFALNFTKMVRNYQHFKFKNDLPDSTQSYYNVAV